MNTPLKTVKNKTTRLRNYFKYYLYEFFKHEDFFKSVEKYCMFIGYTRSGHSLIGSLLDAHPNIIISHELNALRLFEKGISKRKIYYLILQNSRRQSAAVRQETGYSYQVPNQWQGKFKTLKVIGDKRGSGSNRIIRDNPDILKVLENKIDVPIKFIHVIRNPYDNISTIAYRTHRKGDKLEYGINLYFKNCEAVQFLKTKVSKNDIYDVRHESLIDDPRTVLKELCAFLEVEAPQDYLEDCAGIIFKSPKKTRFNSHWSNELIELVKNKIGKFEFLREYSYEGE